jgi:hypothetical protein
VQGHTGHRESAPLTVVGFGTQRSDNSVENILEHLKRCISLTLIGSSNADNEMLLMCIVLEAMFARSSPT